MLWVLWAVAQLADGGPVGASGSFPSASKGIQSTAVLLVGQDTSDARIVGRVTAKDTREYCHAWEHDRTPAELKKCLSSIEGEIGKQEVATADCVRGEVMSYGRRAVLQRGLRFKSRYGDSYDGTWRLKADGELVDSSMASGGPTMSAQFSILCPATVRASPLVRDAQD